jgi:hypothetical protein
MPVHVCRLQALLLVGLVFCVGAWSQTKENSGPHAQVYVYANWESPEHKWIDIACDDETVAKIKAGRFFVMKLPPGRHAVSARDGIPVFIDARSGEKSFLRLGREIDGQTVMPVLTKVDSTQALKEIVHLAYIDAAKVLSNAVLQADPGDLWQQPRLKTRGNPE